MCNSEKKAWFLWAVFLLVLMLAFGCKSTKDITNETQTNTSKFTLDSTIVNSKTTEPSLFEFDYKIPTISSGNKDCDSICKRQMDELLSGINNRFKNGENELKIYYDKYNRILRLYNKIKGSKDSIKIQLKIEKEYYNITKKRTITITKNELTKEQKINVWVGRLFWLFLTIFIIYKLKVR